MTITDKEPLHSEVSPRGALLAFPENRPLALGFNKDDDMVRRIRFLLLAAALAAVPGTVVAQTTQVEYVGNYGWHYDGIYVGPYHGLVSAVGTAPIDMYCVDSAHWITAGNNPWNAWMTPLEEGESLSNTYLHGTTGAYDRYWQAAYLTTKFWDAEVDTNRERGAIHAAIWSITTGTMPSGFDPPTGSGDSRDYQYWRAQAATNYVGFRASNRDEWIVLSDIAEADRSQEFLIRRSAVVPEPATWTMLLIGLFGLAGVGFVRGRSTA